MRISWPLFAQDFRLEQSSFDSLADWNPGTYKFVTNESGISAVVPEPVGIALFRLRK